MTGRTARAARSAPTLSQLVAAGTLPEPRPEEVARVAGTDTLDGNIIEGSGRRLKEAFTHTDPPAPSPAEAPKPPLGSSSVEKPTAAPTEVLDISVGLIDPSPYQPRIEFDEEALQGLANTLLSEGQLQPIAVRRKTDGRFELVAGERRWKAAMLTGKETLSAIVQVMSDGHAAMATLTENAAREGLSDYEIGKACKRLLDIKDSTGRPYLSSISSLARRVGLSRAKVDRCLDFMKLPEEAIAILDTNPGIIGGTSAELLAKFVERGCSDAVIKAIEAIRDRGISEQHALSQLKREVTTARAPSPRPKTLKWHGEPAIKARIHGRRLLLTCEPGVSPGDLLERLRDLLDADATAPAAE